MEFNINQGFVKLEDFAANDLDVVNAARVSFQKKSLVLQEADVKLIYFLMKERHGTPFEHNYFKFHVKCPIFVAREWFRHRIGSFNEMSMRYHQPDLEFFLPDTKDFRTQVGKPGNYTFEQMNNEDGRCDFLQAQINALYEQAEELYLGLIDSGVAKELSRVVLPVATYTEFYWSVNARPLMNFISLRSSEHAQKEIRDYAESLEVILSTVMPVTYEAFLANGKVAV